MELENKLIEKKCEKHGLWACEQVKDFPDITIPNDCPKCYKEIQQKEQEEYLQRQKQKAEYKRLQKIQYNLQSANIPLRFKDKTLENYQTPHKRQKEVLQEIQDFIEHFETSPGIIILGNPGTGKNHLAIGIVKKFVEGKELTALMTTALKIVRSVKESWQAHDSEEDALKTFLEPVLLVIDEVGVQFGSDTEKLYLSEIVNERYEHLKPTILLGNVTLKEVSKNLGERVIERFKEGGKVLVFDWESWRGKFIEPTPVELVQAQKKKKEGKAN